MLKKYFIITAGPTGSGKTKLVEKTLEKLNINPKTEYTKFLIDDLIENDDDYKRLVKEIIKDVEVQCHENCDILYQKSCKIICEKFKYLNPSDNLFKKFNDAYFQIRKGISHDGQPIGCINMRDEGDNCEEILDNRLKKLASGEIRPNIVVFEITGTYIPAWLLSDNFIPHDYEIVVSYALVNLENLIIRNKKRAYNSIVAFKNNSENPAPRFPNVRKKQFKKIVEKIKSTVIDLHALCIESYDIEKCGNRRIDYLFLFDNNGSEYQLIYDSKFNGPQNIRMVLESALGNLEGGKRKTRQKKIKQNKRKKTRKYEK